MRIFDPRTLSRPSDLPSGRGGVRVHSERAAFASVTCRSAYPSALITLESAELPERPTAAFERTLKMMSAALEAAFNQSHFRQKGLCAAEDNYVFD